MKAHELKKRTQNAIIRFIIFCLCNYIVRCLVHMKFLNVQTECAGFLKLGTYIKKVKCIKNHLILELSNSL